MSYLSLEEFRQGPCEFEDFDDIHVNDRANGKRIAEKRFLPHRLARHPFLHYAASKWGRHAKGELEQTCKNQILELLGRPLLLKSAVQVQDNDLVYLWPKDKDTISIIVTTLPLYVATSFNLEHMVDILLQGPNKLDLNRKYSRAEVTPLHRAVEQGNTNLTRTLLIAGADTRSLDKSSHSVLYKAIARGYDAITELILSHDRGAFNEPGMLYCAAFSGSEATIRSILIHSEDEAEREERLRLIFHESARLGRLSTIELALKLGADLESKDNDGQTALFLAVKYGRYPTVELLLKANASVSTKALSGETLLETASSSLESLKERLECISVFNPPEGIEFRGRSYPFERPIAPDHCNG